MHDKRGLSDILGALGLEGGKKGDKAETVTKTITAQGVAAAKGNATCAAQKTITVTQQAAASDGTGYVLCTRFSCSPTNRSSLVQLSFVTVTVFGTGAPPTVTVTPLPQMVTQMVTVTVTGAAAAGISPPGAVGTGAVGSAGTGSTPASSSAPAAAAGKIPSLHLKHWLTEF